MKIKLLFAAVFMGLDVLAFSSVAEAATLFLAPPSSEIAIGEKLTIDLKTDSEGISFNAAQTVLRFPKDTLEVVSLDKTDSAFSFWLEEPNFSNADGIISFIGGTPYGTSGSSLQVLKIVFTAKGSGSGIITLSDAAITASDGSGTNILSKTVDAVFAIVAKKETPPVPVPAPTQETIPAPVPVVREPVPTGKLPIEPVLNIPLYPDETKWFNLASQFNVSWDLPLDVTGVSTALNREPNFAPTKSEGFLIIKHLPRFLMECGISMFVFETMLAGDRRRIIALLLTPSRPLDLKLLPLTAKQPIIQPLLFNLRQAMPFPASKNIK